MMEQKIGMAKITQISDQQRKAIYKAASTIGKDTIEEVCPALLRIVLNSEKGLLKNELGRVIFHLQKTETLNSRIGLEKLLDASLMVAPEETYKILESSDKFAQDLAKRIKEII
ncbi:MAG: hypothetical protein JW891_06335 [Candidatus Lokiarchaeota archaeon]|nr:hypothetical protein [Candidatus Lokiarchaeota archaeon]